MVQAAEAQTGLRPRRRVELLQQQLQTLDAQIAVTQAKQQQQAADVHQKQATLTALATQIQVTSANSLACLKVWANKTPPHLW